MKTRVSVLDVVVSDGHAVFYRYVKPLVAEAVNVMVARVRILDRFRRAPRDPRFILAEKRLFGELPDRAACGHDFRLLSCAAAFDANVFPNAAGVFPDIRLRDLAFFHNDIPIGIAFTAENMIHVIPVCLIKLKTAVFFYKLNEAFFKHNMSS